MQSLFALIYLIFLSGVVIATLFIIFHLSRYSLNRRLAFGMTIFFLIVTGMLIISNAALFFSIPFESFVPQNSFVL